MTDTPYYPDIAVPAQLLITVKRYDSECDDGECYNSELEIAQELNGEQNAIYCQLSNVVMLVGAIFRAAGMDDIRLIHDLGSGCEDVPLTSYRPDLIDTEAEALESKIKDRTAAERQRRSRANKAKRDSERDSDPDGVTVTRDARDSVMKEPKLRLVAAE